MLSFSELRSRADLDIDSGQFNYHLQQLLGHFVEQGYRMRTEGRALYQTLRAVSFDTREQIDPVDAEFNCYFCETAVEATVDDGAVTVRCPGCAYHYALAGVPPGAIEDGELALEQVGAYYHHRHLAFARGVCITCGEVPGIEFLPADAVPIADPDRQDLYVYRACENCGDQRHLTLGTALLPDPELVAFCRDQGTDVLSTPLWELEFAATDRFVTVHARDPWKVSLTITGDEEALELVVDEELQVVERSRA